MNQINQGLVSPSLLSICIDGFENQSIYGNFFHCFSREPIPFMEGGTLLLAIDNFFNSIEFPQASTKSRSFKNKSSSFPEKEFEKCMSEDELLSQKGAKATFVVNVQYRQNATWQGSVVWANKNITKNFRSALELLKLIDEALDNENIPSD